jgi:NADH-quinone oxidoreductase subunit L
MLLLVTIVSSLVHIYTIGYMEGEPGYARFFAYIALFTFSMLMLVMADNLLQLFVFWEAVGLCSYLLIGHWFDRPSACGAATKAFIVNRVGDFGFILGLFMVWYYAGSLDYATAFGKAQELGGLTIRRSVQPGTSRSSHSSASCCSPAPWGNPPSFPCMSGFPMPWKAPRPFRR